jgi:DNA-binding transcriptional LysR family regulator
MELHQLEYLVAVVEEGSFTAGARRVHVSQSGVSAQIAKLERELGSTLLDRSGRAVTLTPAGRAAIEHARTALGATAALRQAVDDVRGVVRGRLSVGMITGCRVRPFFDALAGFQRTHPLMELALFEAPSDELVERVRLGTADLTLAGVAGDLEADLGSAAVLNERIVAAVAPDDALSRRRSLRLRDLVDRRLITLPRGSGIRAVFDQACAAASVDVEVELEANAPGAVADLAARGLGVGIVNESTVAEHRGRLKSLRIQDAPGLAGLALLWRPPESPAVRELLLQCRDAFGV